MKFKVYISLRESILDPQGEAIRRVLDNMGHHTNSVRCGKMIELIIPAVKTKKMAISIVEDMCKSLLANPVTEDYIIEYLGKI
jgi:phosphoribosylformylglycinamidine synthase subunit PurS